ncbi:MAG: hypothetical protein KAS72_09800 [Phycisphaerales bacterium]|nr:hypothetical protein [Phycisphaerales bacterium]
MKRILTCMCLGTLSAASASGAVATLPNVPDFSQHANAAWVNYCAPTCGGDVAYYFSNTYAQLRQGNAWGNNNGATGIIGGLNPPPPPPASMAGLMGTSTQWGTTAMAMTVGLDTYMEDNWDGVVGGADWITAYIPTNPAQGGPGGPAFWAILQNEINLGSGIILTIAWMNGNPTDPAYDIPEDYMPDTDPYGSIGHAVTMVGYNTDAVPSQLAINDPANNAGVHNWGGETAWYNINVGANNLTIGNLGGVQATIYGAVITNIPAPGTAVLLALGVATAWRRRR